MLTLSTVVLAARPAICAGPIGAHFTCVPARPRTAPATETAVNSMTLYVFALLIGIVAGLRALMAPAVVSWAARLGWLNVAGTWAAFLGKGAIPYVISALAILEL